MYPAQTISGIAATNHATSLPAVPPIDTEYNSTSDKTSAGGDSRSTVISMQSSVNSASQPDAALYSGSRSGVPSSVNSGIRKSQ